MNGPCVSIHGGCHRVKYSSNYIPQCHFEISPHLMSPNDDDEWRVDIFSNSSSCPKFVNRTFTGWQMTLSLLSSDSRDQPELTFFISPSGGNTWMEKYFSWNICPISRIVIFMSFIIVVSPNRHFRQCPSNEKVRIKETSKSLRLQTLWWAPLQTYFLQIFL